MKVGYARISRPDQHLSIQEEALKNVGCEQIYSDVASGANTERPGLVQALKYMREGDTFVVCKLDRLGRSITHLIKTVKDLQEKRIDFICLQESIDTSTSSGKLNFHIFSALAEFERDVLRERTEAGLIAARKRGLQGGRRPIVDDEKKVKRMIEMYHEQKNTVAEICKIYDISRPSFYNYLKRQKLKE